MKNNSNENIKEIFIEIIKEVDEKSLKFYVKFLNKFIVNDTNKKLKENSLAITKLVELKNFKKQQLTKIENYLLEKTTLLNSVESKIKTAENNHNKLLEKIKQKNFELEFIKIKKQNEELKKLKNFYDQQLKKSQSIKEELQNLKSSTQELYSSIQKRNEELQNLDSSIQNRGNELKNSDRDKLLNNIIDPYNFQEALQKIFGKF